MAAPLALEVSGLSRAYGSHRVVDRLDLEVAEGDIYGFLGPNGAGKTTTMRLILGLIRRDGGEVRIFGESDPVRSRSLVGGIVEGPRFYPYLSGIDNLRVLAAYSGGCTDARIIELLELVRMRDRANDPVRTYSLGMKQRLGIAQALLGSPRLLLLDEPSNGLDPKGMKEVRDLIQRLREDLKVTVFVSSHLLHELDLLCTRIGIIQDGVKVAEGTTEDLVQPGENLESCFLRLTEPGEAGQIR
ncbi:MAG TPA: ABC transporter ATP-binding protein [Deltaproteobacteria bacterium]|nr:ABC transporter ATP-binding protein [Deltaproteobacteria bacterium]HCP44541.1 ABC transporter ATP-binding protein [Deltaproteobacteria bacterium]